MIYRVIHRTEYSYSERVTVSHHAARVAPRATPIQTPVSWNLDIVPEPGVRRIRTDYFGNQVCYFSIQELHDRLEIRAESRVELVSDAPRRSMESPAWEQVVAALRQPGSLETLEAQQFAFESPHVRPSPPLAELARESFEPGRPLLEAMAALNRSIHQSFTFDSRATTVATPLETVLQERRGVCQDFTHLALGCLRSLGLAARYVSGYLRTIPAEGRDSWMGAEASHAWVSVFCPGQGWVDYDPTNDLMPAQEHITVAYGRDFADVSPVTGIIMGGGEHTVRVSVQMEPV